MIEYASGKATRQKILEYIGWYCSQYGLSPSMREIAQGLKMSTPNVAHHLAKLKQAGLVSTIQGKARSIKIVEKRIGNG